MLNISQVLSVVNVNDYTDCGFQCLANVACLSFNYAILPTSSSTLHFCQLLATDKYNHSTAFVQSDHFHHYTIAVWWTKLFYWFTEWIQFVWSPLKFKSKFEIKLRQCIFSLRTAAVSAKKKSGRFCFWGAEGADVHRLPWLVHENPLEIHQSVIFCLFVSVPCEQRFLSWIAFLVYEVVRVACLSRG